jgi:ferredoxin
VCADLLPGRVVLDDWGYPVLLDRPADPDDEERAVRTCPARALYWSGRSPR